MKRTVSLILALVTVFAMMAMAGCNSAYRYRGVTTAPIRDGVNHRGTNTRGRFDTGNYHHRGRTNLDNNATRNYAGNVTPGTIPGTLPGDGHRPGAIVAPVAAPAPNAPETKTPEVKTEDTKRSNTPAPAPKIEKPAKPAS